jgi:hypothetical protein
MKIFISWSGDRSKALAIALRDWFPLVLHYVEPWLSDKDIEAGARWAVEIGKNLEDSNFGILCVTQENLRSSWLLFEAGALAKSMQNSHVVPLLLDLDFSEVSGPLSQFQAKKIQDSSMVEVLRAINKKAPQPIGDARLSQLFDVLWPQLDAIIKAIPRTAITSSTPVRPEREILEELVTTIRSLDGRLRNLEQELLPAPWEPEAREMVKNGKKINAIKLVREQTGLGLKEAKDLVESWNIE